MRQGVDVRVDADRDRRRLMDRSGHAVDEFELFDGLDIKQEDPGLQRHADFIGTLSHAGKNDPVGRHARRGARGRVHPAETMSAPQPAFPRSDRIAPFELAFMAKRIW